MGRGKQKLPLKAQVDEFGQIQKLAIILLHSDLPQYRIAALAGFPPPRLSEYAQGRRPIPIHHLVALSEVLDMEPQDIVGSMSYEVYAETMGIEDNPEDLEMDETVETSHR